MCVDVSGQKEVCGAREGVSEKERRRSREVEGGVECGAGEEEGKEWDRGERAGAEISGKRGFEA